MKLPGPKPTVWRGYRNCSRCTHWRPVSDYPVRKLRSGFEQIGSVCIACKNGRERERYNGLSQDEKHEYGKKVNLRTRIRRHHALHTIAHQRDKLDKAERKISEQEEKLEAIKGKYRLPWGTNNGSAVDIVPFRMWLLRQHRLRDYNTTQLANEMGQDHRRVSAWLQGFHWTGPDSDPVPIRSINIDVLDDIAVKLGDPGLLGRIYPLEVD